MSDFNFMKPNFQTILNSDSLRITADIAVEAISNNPDYFEEVINMSLNSKSPMNWRSSRVIALSVLKYPKLFIPYVNKIAQLFSSFKDDGLKRSYSFALSKYCEYLNEKSQADLIEICFDYMLSNEKVAVKYNCLKLLYEMCKIIPELKGELQAAIDFNISEGCFRMNGEIRKIYNAIDIQVF